MAERIATQLNKKVLIIEKRNHIGGNCFDFKDENNILIHKYGPHLFHTNNKEVIEYLSNFTDWDIYNHEVLAYIDGAKVAIPFNFNTLSVRSYELASDERLADAALPALAIVLIGLIPVILLSRALDRSNRGAT